MSDIHEYLQSQQQRMISCIEALVRTESPTYDKQRVDACGKVLAEQFREHLGITPEVYRQDQVGNHMKFTFGKGEEQVLIVGHFDTVWEPGRLAYRVEENRIYGPGILDMKAGLVQALWAAKALRELGLPVNKRIVFLCNSDEEVGSITSRALIEEEAKRSKAVFVVEAAQAVTGALKTARKGVSIYKVRVRGRAAHAGNHHEDGISAVRELARLVEYLESLTDYDRGTTVNVGVVHGGTRSNVVPEGAEADVDVRTVTWDEADRIHRIMEDLKPSRPGLSVTVSGGINRPPMERTEKTGQLFRLAQDIARELGLPLQEAMVGGGSDGNFTAAVGAPTLDGLGAVGDGPHAEHEHILIPYITQRAALLAHLLERV
ncbi:M20 family metallopeptidase [Kyrpidia sp.]|uniref:M20 family metallopeptidase n=1 Tax=Kyrpidia sp. TaxID=2073077 RepID=UPI00258ABA67|nr:M20 family metallopeptidase [Kyrpidia sp.]